MSDPEFPPIDVPARKPRRSPLVARLRSQIEDLKQERDGLLERAKIAEAAACQNLQYAQAAREVMEELSARILARLPLSADKPRPIDPLIPH
jgi:hypothetical protein